MWVEIAHDNSLTYIRACFLLLHTLTPGPSEVKTFIAATHKCSVLKYMGRDIALRCLLLYWSMQDSLNETYVRIV